MGQEQMRTDGPSGSRTEKTPPIEKDRAVVSKFDERMQNNDAMKYKGKQSPLSKPT
jgi:hypothetical protein